MNEKRQPNAFVKYSGIGMQMLVPILVGVWGGKSLDEAYLTDPIWTVVLSLLGVFSGLYLALRQLIDSDKDKK